MPDWTDRDPLAVSTRMEAGEEVAYGDPYVSDAERAAAGRETLAERTRALLPANRERAAARYASGEYPDDEEVQRVWRARDPADLRGRLGAGHLAVWAEDDVLHALWRGDGDQPHDQVLLSGGVSVPMWPVEGAAGLWEASLRIRRLDEAVISLYVQALQPADPPFGRPPADELTWHGPRAPQGATAGGATAGDGAAGRPLAGEFSEHVVESAAVRAARAVSVYVPPAEFRAGPLPGCVLADGESTRAFAEVLEAAIASGAAPAVVLVGVHNGGDPADPAKRSEVRAQEYLPRYKPRRFAAHLSFVSGEVIPWAAAEFPVAGGPWISAGFSNGAAWAIGAAQRRPDVFGGVAAFSAGIVPQRVAGPSRGVRHFLAAGTLEGGFRRATREWAERLRRAGVPYSHREWAGGHDPFWWQHYLPDALAWLLG